MSLELRSLVERCLGAGSGPWLERLLVLAVGTAVIVGLSALVGRFIRSAVWQRTIWQVNLLALVALVVTEFSGTGPALVRLWRMPIKTATDQMAPDPGKVGTAPGRVGTGQFPSAGGKRLSPGGFRPPVAQGGPAGAEDLPEIVLGLPREDRLKSSGGVSVGQRGAGDRSVAVGSDGHARLRPEERFSQRAATPERGLDPPAPDAAPRLVAGPLPRESGCAWWFGAIWAVGAVAVMGRMLCAHALLLALRVHHGPIRDQALCHRVGAVARRLGMRRPVHVLEGVGLRAPVAFGTLRPTIALPRAFADDFNQGQQEAILAHEFGHLAASDPAWETLANLLCAALWWHPLAWHSRGRLRAASEAAADEASLVVPNGPDLLAASLVTMGRRLARPPKLGWVSFEGPGFRSGLGRRVERLLNLRTRSWRAPGRGRLVFAKTVLPVALTILAVCCTAWARPQATLEKGATAMNVLTTSWRQSLAAAALAFFSAGCADAVADDPAAGQPQPAVVGDDLSDAEGQLALLAEDEPREAREGEEREEEEREAREGEDREEEEEEEGEAREGEQPEEERREAGDREEREREEPEAREGEERRRPELDQRRRLTLKLHVLEKKSRDIRRELRGLRDDQDAEARELQGALREVEERIEGIRRELRGPERDRERPELGPEARHELQLRLRALMQNRRELERRALEIKRKLHRLRRDDQAEEAHEVQRMLHEVQAAAERVERQRHEVMRWLGISPERPRPDRPRPARRADLERRDLDRRIRHMRAAIENLRAGGFHDLAERLAREADELIRIEGRPDFEPQPGPPEPPRPPEPRERPAHPDLGPRVDQHAQAIEELGGSVRQLRREMDEIREMLQTLLERSRREE